MPSRAWGANDTDRVTDLWRAAAGATHHVLTPGDRRAIAEDVCRFLSTAPSLLATDADGRAVGPMRRGGAHMDALFIDPVRHRTGAGRALVDTHRACIRS